VTSAQHAGQRRWLVLVVVVLVIAGLAVAARSPGQRQSGGPPLAPASMVSTPDTESSAWYCTGQTTVAGALAPGSVVLTNTAARPVTGTIHAVTDTGATANRDVSVPARGQVVATVPAPKTGTWLSEVVMLSGGGVAVSQTVHSSSGWAEAPCQSSTSQRWYFPSGVTLDSDSMFIALFNPTSTPDVVDLSFATPKGVLRPINFQGLVLQPDQTQVESVGPFVQDQAQVSTTVTTRTGRLVAGELELFTGSVSGLAIVPGSARAEDEWTIPQSVEATDGSSTVDVYNPGTRPQEVTVQARLGSGPLSPFRVRVPPQTTWVLSTTGQTRLPKGDPYAAVIEARGGSGVVVGRIAAVPGATPAPSAGMVNAVDALTARTKSSRWVVPAPGTPADPAVAGAAPLHLAVTNLTARPEHYVVYVMTPSRLVPVSSGDIAALATYSAANSVLAQAGRNPVIVQTDGRSAVSEDLGPSGTFGAVSMPGIALARSLG
jgi:Family of unknown function (DUF5719)